ncbi:ABC transporter substrate-binding protein [Atribacter laminatus]|uniref:Putative sugar-binding periplasmic protein n=1 Tax=Atribacter laminatus TaxID=2847778 RepID=A0A7T1AM94_ATRLM|nr:ABC transporter substrate-binding protein [Atribacter laminatus]QPM68488.1 putative sugar-binding periplasmic protein [Atribacter laminatus]
MKFITWIVVIFSAILFIGLPVYSQDSSLTVIGPWSGGEMDAFLPVLKAFEEETGIKVEFLTYRAEDLSTLLPAQFTAESTLGDLIFMQSWFIQDQAKKGHIMDISAVITEDDFIPGSLDGLKVDGKLYGAAYTGKVKPGFWFRKSFFEKNQLTVPNNWEDFQALLEKMKGIEGISAPIASGNGVGWPLSDITEHFIVAFGGTELFHNLINHSIHWNDAKVKEIFENRLAVLLKENYFGEPSEWTMVLEKWWNGDYGLFFMGSWITGMVDDPSDLSVFSLPGTQGLVFAPDYLFIPAYTQNPENAKKLLAFLVTQGQELQVQQGGHLATYLNVPIEFYPEVDRNVAQILEGKMALPDLDDTIGGEFQSKFWDQLKLLWVKPEQVDDVLDTLESVFEQ